MVIDLFVGTSPPHRSITIELCPPRRVPPRRLITPFFFGISSGYSPPQSRQKIWSISLLRRQLLLVDVIII